MKDDPAFKKRSKILLKVHDFFNREFNWPPPLKFPDEKLEFSLNYDLDFDDNLKSLKKRFHLKDYEINKIKNRYYLHYLIHRFEKKNYQNKKILNKIYENEFKDSIHHFIEVTTYLINKAKDLNINPNLDNYTEHRILINIILGISFEYSCKSLLLSKGYKINEYCTGTTPIKSTCVDVKVIKSRTLSLEICWDFIKQNKLIPLNEKEIMIGNYLSYLRNVQSHVPVLMYSRGTYNDDSIKLMNKLLDEVRKCQN